MCVMSLEVRRLELHKVQKLWGRMRAVRERVLTEKRGKAGALHL